MRIVSNFWPIALCLGMALMARSAYADPTTQLGQWFCATLKDFDVDTAFSTFPLQPLGERTESREKTDDTFSVRVRAEGMDLAVEYGYQFNEEDVDDRYGFTLQVEDKEGEVLDERGAMLWLMEFGEPQRSQFGWQVGVGMKRLSPRFSFSMGDSPYVGVAASWFEDKDMSRAGPICDAAKAPPENVLLPNDLGAGEAVDPKKDQLSLWFCSVLRKDFDFADAIAKFPLQPLTIEAERRGASKGVVQISREAKGDNYSVRYKYSYRDADVDRHYGFGLWVTYTGGPRGSVYEDGMKWLRGFGTPTRDVLGYSVAAVPPRADGLPAPFSFAFWSSGVHSAQWFYESDINLSTKLCPQ